MVHYHVSPPTFCAEDATLQALLNGFLREVDSGRRTQVHNIPVIEIALLHCSASLRVEVAYQSETGPHAFGALKLRFDGGITWQSASSVQVIALIAQECFARHPESDAGKLPEFLRAVFDSNAQISKVVKSHAPSHKVTTFLDAEQALAFGHWLHPTPKTREGMTDWHLDTYAPEFHGSFQLAYFAVHASILRSGSGEASVDEMLSGLPEMPDDVGLSDDEHLLPAHPLQADALMLDDDIRGLLASGKMRYLGQMGGEFAATSSVRTLYAANSPWMLKFSIPVRLTNSLRVTKRNELAVGVVMAKLLNKLSFNRDNTAFQIINDPAYITVDIPTRAESGFELVLRDNPFPQGQERDVFNIAALTADPMPGEASLLSRTVQKAAMTGHTTALEMAQTWFSAYLACCVDPLLDLYNVHGIALEAHQQNALVALENGVPKVGYFRDNQSYLITRDALPRLARIEPGLTDLAVIAYDAAHINTRLAYYLVINQVFAVIRRLGRDGLLSEQSLLRQMVRHLQYRLGQLSGPAADFVTYLLTAPTLETKANLLTRVQDIDELEEKEQEGLFIEMANPIAQAAKALADETILVQERLDVPA